jgi:hypothetical protein
VLELTDDDGDSRRNCQVFCSLVKMIVSTLAVLLLLLLIITASLDHMLAVLLAASKWSAL